jgi:thioredoxin reductase
MSEITADLAIVGAGPAGLFAAYYAGFRGFSVVVIDALPEVGGQVSAMYPEKEIFDIAGIPAIRGRELVDRLTEQAARYNPTYVLSTKVVGMQQDDASVTLSTDRDGRITAKAVIISGGIGSFTPRALPTGDDWLGKGMVYFVPSLQEHAGKDVVIVGGGDSAFDWAWSLRDIAKSLTIVHRRDAFRAHATTVDAVRDAGVRLIVNAEIAAVAGGDVVETVTVRNKSDGIEEVLPCETLVAALGFVANIGPITEWGLELEKRHIKVASTMFTNLPRVLACGDICTYEGRVPLIAVGFGEAATAVNNAAHLIDPTFGLFPGHSSGGSAE